jgi:hypothetical protein
MIFTGEECTGNIHLMATCPICRKEELNDHNNNGRHSRNSGTGHMCSVLYSNPSRIEEEIMPYIVQDRRDELETILWLMREKDIKADGDLNYILFAFVRRYLPESYNSIKNFCGELRQCATEIERRILAPYEDMKIEENGDVD